MNFKESRLIKLFSNSINDFLDTECIKFSASLSYFTIFALPSFTIILISFFGYFFGADLISSGLFNKLNAIIGEGYANELKEVFSNQSLLKTSILETIIGIGALLFSASGMFSEMQSSINDIWQIKGKPKRGLIRIIIDEFYSLTMILIFGLIILILLGIDSFIETWNSRLKFEFNQKTLFIADYLDSFLVFVLLTLFFVYIFKELPDAVIKFKDAFVSALFTTVLFMIGKWGIGLYLESSDKFSLYGTAGSILILLFWVYYSALIFFFGATFLKNYALLFGTPIQPDSYSEFKK